MIQVITHTESIPGEAACWQALLNEGADSILLRRPGWQATDYDSLLQRIDAVYYSRIMIAEHAVLCDRYGLQGIHFSEAARGQLTAGNIRHYRERGWRLSTSIHSVSTLRITSNNWDQLLLSPVFDSISKPGYKGAMDERFRLHKEGYAGRVLALGGINEVTAGRARQMQFDGIALLGAIWQEPEQAIDHFRNIRDIWKGNILTT